MALARGLRSAAPSPGRVTPPNWRCPLEVLQDRAGGPRRASSQADRRRRLDHALELAGDDRLLAHHSRDPRRQHRRDQAIAAHAAVDHPAGRDRSTRCCRRRGQRRHRRERYRRAHVRASRHRKDDLHRLDRDRAQDHAERRDDAEAADAGTRRQRCRHRVARRRSKGDRRGPVLGRVHQRRPDLRGAEAALRP